MFHLCILSVIFFIKAWSANYTCVDLYPHLPTSNSQQQRHWLKKIKKKIQYRHLAFNTHQTTMLFFLCSSCLFFAHLLLHLLDLFSKLSSIIYDIVLSLNMFYIYPAKKKMFYIGSSNVIFVWITSNVPVRCNGSKLE